MKKLNITVEVGFEDSSKDSIIESAKMDLRDGLKELVFETVNGYVSIMEFKINEIVLDENGSDTNK